MAETGYPILEFDRDPNAKINPEMMAEGQFSTDKLVITFFPEVMEQLKAEGKIRLEQTIAGENPILVYRFTDADVLIILGAIGCPACAGTLDQLHAMGIQKVMFCGGGGVLDPNIGVGQLLLVEGAIRDEGFSYHYIEPSRIIYTEEFKVDCVLRYAQGESPVQLFREAGLDPSLIGYKRIECAIARWRRQMNVAATTGKQPRGKRGNAVMADLRAPTHIDASFAPQAIGSRGDIRDVLIAQQVRRIDELERQVDELSRELRKLSAPHGDAGSDPMGASGETRA